MTIVHYGASLVSMAFADTFPPLAILYKNPESFSMILTLAQLAGTWHSGLVIGMSL